MQRKKKRSIIFELHSIPIRFRNYLSKHRSLCKRLYLVSYSIPLSCMVVLLLGGIIAINPQLGDLLVGKTNAVMIRDEWAVTESGKLNASSDSDELNNSTSTITEGSVISNNTDTNSSSTSDDSDAGISLASVISTPTLAITVSNTDQTINAVQGGNTVYGTYNVGLTGSNVKDYTLSIKADSSNLTMPSGASSSTSTVSGVGSGTVGSSMGSNKWGYVVTDVNTNNYEGLTYKTVPTSATSIASSTIASPYNLSTSKKLVFAAKFGDNATPGKYTGSITLSLSATPAQTGQLWSNGTPSYITDMQDIQSGFCASSIPVGSTIDLKDNRDSNTYTIVKLEDNKCWMQQNLRLTGNRTLTPSDSDVSSNWPMPASLVSLSSTSFSGSNYHEVESYYRSNTLNSNGVYYSFTAATAGTATSSATSGETTSSVCPKGWKLPTSSEYSNMLSAASIGNNSAGSTKIRGDKYKFPYAGYVNDGSLYGVGSYGYYWSRTVYNSNRAYYLSFGSSYVYIASDNRFNGYSVRCVANS